MEGATRRTLSIAGEVGSPPPAAGKGGRPGEQPRLLACCRGDLPANPILKTRLAQSRTSVTSGVRGRERLWSSPVDIRTVFRCPEGKVKVIKATGNPCTF
jgi:hypothetical protein